MCFTCLRTIRVAAVSEVLSSLQGDLLRTLLRVLSNPEAMLNISEVNTMTTISAKDKARLRELAKHQLELAKTERNVQLYKDWEAHGDMSVDSRPIITVELWTFADEIITPRLQCESKEARSLEASLLHNTINFDYFKDDTIVRDYIPIGISYGLLPFNMPIKREETGGLGYQFIHQIEDLAEDFDKLSKSKIDTNLADRRAYGDFVQELIGDILPTKEVGVSAGASLTQNIVQVMGMENMYMAMMDEPELFHRMMKMLTDDNIEMHKMMEADGILLPTNGDVDLAQGTFAFTSDLPKTGTGLKLSDLWIYIDSQEAAGLSPDMYHEFIFPYYKQLGDLFGLLSYGCCESVSEIWEKSVSAYGNLRKLSISPWCDEEYIGEQLQHRNVVYHRKPFPNLIGVDRYLDEDAARAHIAKTINAAKKVKKLEFSQRDVYTVHNDLGKVERFVQIIREECERR